MSTLIEKVFEPEFLNTNHGFRPNYGTHTALESITKWSGTKWFIEGDITAFFRFNTTSFAYEYSE
jgi:retron-type reverse transcriptase